jgi:hypothetical protein
MNPRDQMSATVWMLIIEMASIMIFLSQLFINDDLIFEVDLSVSD